ncbi:hypothetical protein CN980_32005 [Bacillus cereus]|uniref:Uncharacterized protein n=1 Tax=Bacillus cereus TaxID=1396 RepID=A0A9X7GLT6_BACCE|nr:hypothetical protein [Bacillus cereus]PGO56273.1 hypothetical protein CN980_32005 [Bacillus cereus]
MNNIVHIHPTFIQLLSDHVSQWSFERGITLKTYSIYAPNSDQSLVTFESNFAYTGNLERETKILDLDYHDSVSNNTDNRINEIIDIPFSVSQELKWTNDYILQIPEKNYIIPFIPQEIPIALDSGTQINLFADTFCFYTALKRPRHSKISLFIEAKAQADITMKLQKHYVSQPYNVTLYITGNVLLIGTDLKEYLVPIVELMSNLQDKEGFTIEGDTLIFHGTGKFTAELSMVQKFYVKQTTWGPNPIEFDYEVFPIGPPISER